LKKRRLELRLRGLIPNLETLKVRLESWTVHWLQHLLKRVLSQMKVQATRLLKRALKQRNSVLHLQKKALRQRN
jgi:hypothetical protein